jgi:hypothetical protein
MSKLYSKFHSLTDRSVSRILLFCGLLLLAGEAYKQTFLYFVINSRVYDWWYFPFQLCSLPMYLCILQYFLPEGTFKKTVYTFMQDFNLLGGIAALIVSEGFRGIHWSLTLHGYLWHILLVLIGLFIHATGRAGRTNKDFLKTIPLFAVCCVIATIINVKAPGDGIADMFYISPYHPSSQPVIHELALAFGIIPANLVYLLLIVLGGYLIHLLFSRRAAYHNSEGKNG